MKLNPENLGALTIRLTQSADGTLQVVLRTSTVKAADLLNQHMSGLNAALQGYSQNEVRVEVQRNEDSQQAQQQQQQQTDPNGHNRQQQEQQQRQEESHSGDFLQKLRLGLFGTEDM
ncbi:MAG: flagellar hook-length control protein FliK [Oscillospiraceae bacterium]|nr:flagellar hook-length control protein FliK [Oscillospiraceae bacterium]